jgi:selenium metabolism protein YedF
MKLVDTRGQQCPAPLIATRKALKGAAQSETFKVLTDNKTSHDNITRYLADNKIAFTVTESAGVWTISITAGINSLPLSEAEEYCTTDVPHFSKGDFVIAFASDKMGEGDEALGKLLIINFLKAIKDLDILPSCIVFYNNGVKLGIDGTGSAEHLKEIGSMGVKLVFCATCAKHYTIEPEIRIGILGNMFEIAQIMASAGNVIKP